MDEAAPLDLRRLFEHPWEGEGTIAVAPWLRWFPAPRRFDFRSEIRDVDDVSWTVVDTTTFPDGSRQVRRMRARQVKLGRIEVAADDMPGGSVITTRPDGFTFAPYVIRTPVLGPLRVPLRYSDDVQVDLPGGTLIDHIEIRLGFLRVAAVTIRLRRADRCG